MKNWLLVVLVAASQWAAAQIVDVVSIQQLPVDVGTFYHPTLSPQGDYLLVSDQGYNGLVKIDLATNQQTILSTASSAGYSPSISPDGKKIAFREVSYRDKLRYVSVKSIDLSAPKTVVEEMTPSRNFSGMRMTTGALKIAQGKKEVSKKIGNAIQASDPPLVTSEDGVIVMYKNGVRTELAPNGKDKRYVRPSVSPDGTKLVYTMVIPESTWVCDIDGKNPVALGYLNTPQWLGNQCIIGMTNKDDGHTVLSSSIDVVTVDGKTRQTLTPASMKAMCPSVSADGKTVAFYTDNGGIYIMNINVK